MGAEALLDGVEKVDVRIEEEARYRFLSYHATCYQSYSNETLANLKLRTLE